MTSKSRSKLSHNRPKIKQNLVNRWIGAAIGVTLLATFANLHHTFITFQNQQLILVDSETFASHKYLPLLLCCLVSSHLFAEEIYLPFLMGSLVRSLSENSLAFSEAMLTLNCLESCLCIMYSPFTKTISILQIL